MKKYLHLISLLLLFLSITTTQSGISAPTVHVIKWDEEYENTNIGLKRGDRVLYVWHGINQNAKDLKPTFQGYAPSYNGIYDKIIIVEYRLAEATGYFTNPSSVETDKPT